jgi:hypothetical protein
MRTRVIAAFSLGLLVAPTFALAYTPDQFTSPESIYHETPETEPDLVLKNECRRTLGIGDRKLTVGSELALLRRCVLDIKQAQKSADLQTKRADRLGRKQDLVGARLQKLKTGLEDYQKSVIKKRRTAATVVRPSLTRKRGAIEEFKSLRAERRKSIQSTENMIRNDQAARAKALKDARALCRDTVGQEQFDCVRDRFQEIFGDAP